MLNVTLEKSDVTLHLPTSIKEITNDYLNAVTSNITVAPNYSLIALVYKDKLSNIILATKQNKNIATRVVCLYVKRDINEKSEFIKTINTGDVVIVSPSDIEIGNHVNCPNNSLSIGRVTNMIQNDPAISKKALAFPEIVCFVEFKLIPNCAIKAKVTETDQTTFIDPFVECHTTRGSN